VIVDTSAIVAILEAEPDAATFIRQLSQSSGTAISAASLVETSLVLSRGRIPDPRDALDGLLEEYDISIAPVTATQARIAREAHERFGRGSGSPAKLNFGDCFAYALARARNEPLLFKGNDFIHTDITPAITPPDDVPTRRTIREDARPYAAQSILAWDALVVAWLRQDDALPSTTLTA